MLKDGSSFFRVTAGAIALLLTASCALDRNTRPGARDVPGAGAVVEMPFADDTSGLLAAAARLCNPIASPEQQAAGLRSARRAFENLSGPDTRQRSLAALALSRCAALCADGEPDAEKVLAVTQIGIDAAGVAGAGGDPRASYYLAVNLGVRIRLLGIDAIGRLGELQAALNVAVQDPSEDQGGALRVLAMLYLRAPAWPVGPGDPEAALPLLKDAVERFPSHPQNHLFYAMALAENDEREKALEELAVAAVLAQPSLWGASAGRWLGEIRALQSQLAQ